MAAKCAVCGGEGTARELLDGRRYAVACDECAGEAWSRWWLRQVGDSDSKMDALATELERQGVAHCLASNTLTPLARAAFLVRANRGAPEHLARAWHACLAAAAGMDYAEESAAWRRLLEGLTH